MERGVECVRKYDDEIARLKQFSDYDLAIVGDLQRRRDQHFERLCEIDAYGQRILVGRAWGRAFSPLVGWP